MWKRDSIFQIAALTSNLQWLQGKRESALSYFLVCDKTWMSRSLMDRTCVHGNRWGLAGIHGVIEPPVPPLPHRHLSSRFYVILAPGQAMTSYLQSCALRASSLSAACHWDEGSCLFTFTPSAAYTNTGSLFKVAKHLWNMISLFITFGCLHCWVHSCYPAITSTQ